MRPSLLLLIPPLTQLNTPYPSTAYLTGFLKTRGYAVTQADLGIEMVLALFSRSGLSRLFDAIRKLPGDLPGEARQMLALERAYSDTIESVIRFLQGNDPTLAPRICQGRFLPEGPRFAACGMKNQSASPGDHARHLATLYLEDLADLVHETVAPQFALSRYAEHVGRSATSFDPVLRALAEPPSLTDELMLEVLWRHVERAEPTVVGLTVPFPGNLYGALRIARALKIRRPSIRIILGGGYANTELRRLTEPGVFDYVDYVTLDDGERPLLCLLEHFVGKRTESALCRTFVRSEGKVVWRNGAHEPDFSMAELGTPTYTGLALDQYISILDTLNPMHRLWSDGHWNKLTVAHGCYWKQCTFCDVGLDYIGRYEAMPTETLVDRIEALVAETGRRGFHFVDEAAPPAGLKALALTLLERGVTITWWGNIRFESAFTWDLCRLLAASGCVAVSAGLEAASDRLLAEMKKGITVAQATRVAAAFKAAGIMVHTYLMYGFPGETLEETLDSLERVRQLFAGGLIQSAFWHKFITTAHSPIGLDPAAHGIRITGPAFGGFADNDRTHLDPQGEAPEWLGEGLRRALFHYKEGEGLTADVRGWFAPLVKRRLKPTNVPRDWASRVLSKSARDEVACALLRPEMPKPSSAMVGSGGGSSGTGPPPAMLERRFIWIGGTPVIERDHRPNCRVIFPGRTDDVEVRLPREKAEWLADLILGATPTRSPTRRPADGGVYPSLREARANYPIGGSRGFDLLMRSAMWEKMREVGLLLV